MLVIQKMKGNGFHTTLLFITFFLFFFSFSLSFATSDKSHKKISSLSNQIIREYKSTQKPKMERIAVVDFTSLDGNPSETGNFIAEQMTSDLSREKNFKIISRADVRKVMSKNSKTTLHQIGNLLGATAVVTGVVTDMGGYEDVSAWLIRCNMQEKVLSSASTIIKKETIKTSERSVSLASQRAKVFLKWMWLDMAGLTAQTDVMSETFKLPKKVLHKESGIVLVLIHPGRFLMGSPDSIDSDIKKISSSNLSGLESGSANFEWEQPQHEVVISKPFYMGQFEVSNKQFRKVFSLHNSGSKYDKSLNADEQPAVNVNHNEAEKFCSEYAMRLPTEAEWEYCARAGSETLYSWGNDPDKGSRYCNVRDIECASKTNTDSQFFAFSDGHSVSAPVGSYNANAFDLHDMHGNVWEWCKDGFQPNFYKENQNNIDPFSNAEEFGPVLRGGSWSESPQSVRSAHRFWCGKSLSRFDRGFRVVLDIPTEAFVTYAKATNTAPKFNEELLNPEVKAPRSAAQARLSSIDPLIEELKSLKDAGNPQWKIVNRKMFVSLKLALHDYPYSSEVYYYYARAYYLHGNWKGASNFLHKTFYYDPHNVDALIFKGDMDYDYGKKSGWYVANRLRLDMTAREAYEAAANLVEDVQLKAEIYLKIGDVYADLSRDKTNAKRYWQKCISIAPDSQAAQLASQRLI